MSEKNVVPKTADLGEEKHPGLPRAPSVPRVTVTLLRQIGECEGEMRRYAAEGNFVKAGQKQSQLDTFKNLLQRFAPQIDFVDHITFYLNGKRVALKQVDRHKTLLEYLREDALLKGCKLACGEGGCGACTVMLSNYDHEDEEIRHMSVNACLCPLFSVDGKHVITIEGVSDHKRGLHPIQQRIAAMFGSQCGFCTPGIVMAMYTFLRNNPRPTQKQIEDVLDGNLCRCTGYRPILDAVKSFAVDSKCPCGRTDGGCCQKSPTEFETTKEIEATEESKQAEHLLHNTASGFLDYARRVDVTTCSCHKMSKYEPYDGQSELIFPPELMKYKLRPLKIETEDYTYYRPVSLKQLLQIRAAEPKGKLVQGNTEVGVDIALRNLKYPVQIGMQDVNELRQISVEEHGLRFGAGVTIAQLGEFCEDFLEKDPMKAGPCIPILQMVRWFGSTQIRNVAVIGGNIVTASPISDLNPVWQANDALLRLIALDKKEDFTERFVPIREFFLKYKTVDLKRAEILHSVAIPFGNEYAFYQCYKQSRRREDDTAICTGAFHVQLEPRDGHLAIVKFGISFGGMAAKTTVALQTEQFLIGENWNSSVIDQACEVLMKDVYVAPDSPGGMEEYRCTLATSFLFKFYLYVSNELFKRKMVKQPIIPESHAASVGDFERPVSSGVQTYLASEDLPGGKVLPVLSSREQVSGDAIYTDDMIYPSALYAAFVVSEMAHAMIVGVDTSEAEKAPGFVAFIDINNIDKSAGMNNMVGEYNDEELFCSGEAKHIGQLIGLVIADTQFQAEDAAKLVKISYKELPSIVTIEEAIEADSFYPDHHVIQCGNVDKAFEDDESVEVVEGEMRTAGQEHFYLEPMVCLCIPKEGSEMTVITSVQSIMAAQAWTAKVLGVPLNKIMVKVKRSGGGFGGKCNRTVPMYGSCAVAAKTLHRPIRMRFTREMDMSTTGGRHPTLIKYKVGFKKDGTIVGIDADIYNNGGSSADYSVDIVNEGIFHFTNAYNFTNLRVRGHTARTNLPTNTSMRGFGVPQVQIVTESIMDHVARTINVPVNDLREMHFFRPNDKTFYRQEIPNDNVLRIWEDLKSTCDFEHRLAEVKVFNAKHRYKKRGLGMMPCMYGMGVHMVFMNQAGAQVQVYTDGSVQVCHGGCEMGQGIHIKMAQVAATALGCPVERVFILETDTRSAPNQAVTPATAHSDLSGLAVWNAARQIAKRLSPVRKEFPDASFNEICEIAWKKRINLAATGYYITQQLGYDWEKNEGTPQVYDFFGHSASCTEVEIDTLTGDFQILRADIIIDAGMSLNPGVDVGQAEGAYMMGVGNFCMEEHVRGDVHKWVKRGFLFTRGPGYYKIPGFGDVPVDFRVTLFKNAPNDLSILASKNIGEISIVMGGSAYFAIKRAIAAAREENGVGTGFFQLNVPSSCERIRMACGDKIALSFTKDPNFQCKLSI